jgi:hypothetical protein
LIDNLIATRDPDGDTSRTPPPLDLSKTPKLKDVAFLVGGTSIRWVIMTLQAAKPKSLRQIIIYSYNLPQRPVEERGCEWRDLDHLLVELWTSHSILPKIGCNDFLWLLAPDLLPELTSKGIEPEITMEMD